MVLLALAATCLLPQDARAATEGTQPWAAEVLRQIKTPLFWFGIVAQFLFFMRFIWQWVVSEQRGRSTIPIIFWYFSVAGGLAMFVYGCLRPDPVIMLGQLLACVIYVRNLMLIYRRAARRRRAGLPPGDLRSVVGEGDVAGEEL